MFQEVARGLGPPCCRIPGCQHHQQPSPSAPSSSTTEYRLRAHDTQHCRKGAGSSGKAHRDSQLLLWSPAAPARTAPPATSPVRDAHLHPAPDNQKAPKPALGNQRRQIPLLPDPRYMFWDLEFELSFPKTKAWFQVVFISIEVSLTQHTTGCTNF